MVFASLDKKVQVLDWYYANGKNQSKTVRHFATEEPDLKLKQPLLSDWLKAEIRIHDQAKNTHSSKRAKYIRTPPFAAIKTCLDAWVEEAEMNDLALTGEVVRKKWHEFADLAGIPMEKRLKLSEMWLTAYKANMGLKQKARHGEAASADPNFIEAERKRLQIVLQNTNPEDIFNMDETALFYGMPPVTGCAGTVGLGFFRPSH